ncbi:hypothetical protein QQS21_010210 [Conoideocrella luteorostrata]|uniref:Probable alpha/beta-glucosidase agdC n=1 Tax=Conoideocrella luteorostrata TaxID=1105319 RepID=A0AAJ0CFM4_9HYPO|nr:hypothetical protein QQS21_010210 [Conoideocrella luteorostrata]
MALIKALLFAGCVAAAGMITRGDESDPNLNKCPGYRASNVQTSSTGLVATLTLAGDACNTYGSDLKDLVLKVFYQTENRMRVIIEDKAQQVYQIPDSIVGRPDGASPASTSKLKFEYDEYPFAFRVKRGNEAIFDTAGVPLIFESQYLRLRTSLPKDPYLYGFGDTYGPWRLDTSDYTRTLWARDAGISAGGNSYANHPFYMEQRTSGAHGVFLRNSNGMDISVNKTSAAAQYLEYRVIGGIVDLYFLAGPTPVEVARQYAGVVGKPAMHGYWTFGFHQCRYGYRDAFEVAEVVQNYSNAKIPLETMWTDIDYMDHRKVFTLDPNNYPIEKVRAVVSHLHSKNQKYIVMVDPAVSYSEYGPKTRGEASNAFVKNSTGQTELGAVWPGAAAFPDWFAANTTGYWTNEFARFFDANTGVDIDGVWNDMNEPSNFCGTPCNNPFSYGPPAPKPKRDAPRRLPGWPCILQPPGSKCQNARSEPIQSQSQTRKAVVETRDISATSGDPRYKGLPGRNLLKPKYAIKNANGDLSSHTLRTDRFHANGLATYDTHNLYGVMNGMASRQAMIARRPNQRPLVISRSVFPGAGAHIGHWTGDSLSTWDQYRLAIRHIFANVALYQVPMIGSDVCGFGGYTTEQLCSRWAALGAFQPFYRNHNDNYSPSQEFYLWPSVTDSARRAIDIRYRLLDYIYTAFYLQSQDGTPSVMPMSYVYPSDSGTWALDLQFFYGPNLLVAPVTDENASTRDVYLPKDLFWNWFDGTRIQGTATTYQFKKLGWSDLPLMLRGGTITPARTQSANTTTETRTKPFQLHIALDANGKANGQLYYDDGISIIQQNGHSLINFNFANNVLTIDGDFGYKIPVNVKSVRILGGKTVDVDLSLNQRSTTKI